jgi:hypothetical protein
VPAYTRFQLLTYEASATDLKRAENAIERRKRDFF